MDQANCATMPERASLAWSARWFALAGVVVVADQLTKWWITLELKYQQVVEILPFFNLVLVHNRGAAFSFLSDAGGWQRWFFTSLASVVGLLLVFWIARLPREKWRESLALALVLGGALGNLYDRVLLGHVIDFLDFHIAGKHWPAFNVADSAICIGAGLLILDSLIGRRKPDNG